MSGSFLSMDDTLPRWGGLEGLDWILCGKLLFDFFQDVSVGNTFFV